MTGSRPILRAGPHEGETTTGDVFWVALDPAKGAEIRKTRPAVIVLNDSCNAFGARVVVLPGRATSARCSPERRASILAEKPARVLGDQIRSIDKSRLRSRIERLTVGEMVAVEEALRITLDLHP